MIIPKNVLAAWKRLKLRGDYDLIVARANNTIGVETIKQAFKRGECADHVFGAIGNFYLEVKAERERALKQKEKIIKQFA